MNRILILTGAVAQGEEIVAQNLVAALAKLGPAKVAVKMADWCAATGLPDNRNQSFASFGSWLPWPRPAAFSAARTAEWPSDHRFQSAGDFLRDFLEEQQPDLVVVTSPIYGALLQAIYQNGPAPDFCLIALAMELDCPAWKEVRADYFLAADTTIERALVASGIEQACIKVVGYPLASNVVGRLTAPSARSSGSRQRILLLANCARKKLPKLLSRILTEPDWSVTVWCDGETDLEGKLQQVAEAAPSCVRFINDLHDLPALLREHQVVVTGAETHLIREAIATQCPVIVPKVGTPQEAANLKLLQRTHAGAGAEKPTEVYAWLRRAFKDDARLLSLWRRNMEPLLTPDATLNLASFVLEKAAQASDQPVSRIHALPALASLAKSGMGVVATHNAAPRRRAEKHLLLCDLHSHTTWSDGKLSVRELVDFYGQRGFDCLCITDHLCDPQRLLGRLVNLTGLVIPPGDVEKYFEAIEREKKRARAKYDLLLMTGLEFNKDGLTAKTSAHLLGIDLQQPVNPSLEIKELIVEIQAQGGLAVASHPHETKGRWGKDTLYFWENVDRFAPLLDAWEVANRDDIFNPVGLKKLPFIANSDFHKPKHIHSWKTLLYCEKEAEAIKHCIRVNRDVSLTLYRDHRFGWEEDSRDLTAETVSSVGTSGKMMAKQST